MRRRPVMNGAPLVDAALRGRIGTPDEVRHHLRHIEAETRSLVEQIHSALASGTVPGEGDPWLDRALKELTVTLQDERRSPLLRALRRRPDEIGKGRVGRRSLDSAWEAVRNGATRALKRHSEAVEFLNRFDELHGRYGRTLRWHLADALARRGIAREDAWRRADAASLTARIDRLGDADAELAELAGLLPESVADPLELSGWPDDVAHAELDAAVRASERTTHEHAALRWRRRGRELAAAHVNLLLGHDPPARASGAARIEAAARESTLLAAAGSGVGADDVDAWGILLRAAEDRRSPGSGLAPRPEAEGDVAASGAILFVVPLFGPYVLVRTGRAWPVRVNGLSVRCGEPAECVAAVPPGAAEISLPLELWADPLLDAPADTAAEWLVTQTPAEIVPFARVAPDRWLARVRRRGVLAAVDEPAGSRGRRRKAPTVRVRLPADALSAGGSLTAKSLEPMADGPFGWRTRIVPLPVADVPRGWLRTAPEGPGRDHLKAEQSFFRAAGRWVPACTLRCLGRESKTGGFLYAPPLASTPRESGVLGEWAASDPLAIVAAAARLWRTLRHAGLALGFYHESTLAFRVRTGPATPPAQALHAVVTGAPLGGLLGSDYRRSHGALALFPAYERLGVRLPPAQVDGATAFPATEAAALALYALDLLAREPLHLPAGAPWDEFVAMLAGNAGEAFREARWAERLIRDLIHTDDALCATIDALAGEGEGGE